MPRVAGEAYTTALAGIGDQEIVLSLVAVAEITKLDMKLDNGRVVVCLARVFMSFKYEE